MSIINAIRAAVSRTLESLARRSIGPDDVEWIVNDLAELGVRINGHHCRDPVRPESQTAGTEPCRKAPGRQRGPGCRAYAAGSVKSL